MLHWIIMIDLDEYEWCMVETTKCLHSENAQCFHFPKLLFCQVLFRKVTIRITASCLGVVTKYGNWIISLNTEWLTNKNYYISELKMELNNSIKGILTLKTRRGKCSKGISLISILRDPIVINESLHFYVNINIKN